jgi:hypothetical protein
LNLDDNGLSNPYSVAEPTDSSTYKTAAAGIQRVNLTALFGVLVAAVLLDRVMHTYLTKRERAGLRLLEGPLWWVSPAADTAAWLRSLPLLEPENGVLYLEGVPDPHVRDFLERHPYPEPTRVGPLTLWPETDFYHLAATVDNLEALSQLLRAHSVARLSYHAALYKGARLLLEWYEAFCPPGWAGVAVEGGKVTELHESPMYVAIDVPEERVRSFATALSSALRLEEEQGAS